MPTPLRSFRVPDNVWLPAVEKARERGESLSMLIVDFLRGYLRPAPPDDPADRMAPVSTPARRVSTGQHIFTAQKPGSLHCTCGKQLAQHL